mmetsp:Transcript_8153/g.20144  ORF Transcript_8153/g.20144 Transcript_8153/m.20144 type:complete len:203 (-) Transcript_8153:1739-2347(-)
MARLSTTRAIANGMISHSSRSLLISAAGRMVLCCMGCPFLLVTQSSSMEEAQPPPPLTSTIATTKAKEGGVSSAGMGAVLVQLLRLQGLPNWQTEGVLWGGVLLQLAWLREQGRAKAGCGRVGLQAQPGAQRAPSLAARQPSPPLTRPPRVRAPPLWPSSPLQPCAEPLPCQTRTPRRAAAATAPLAAALLQSEALPGQRGL